MNASSEAEIHPGKKFPEIVALIQNKEFDLASGRLQNLLKSSDATNADKLWACSLQIRINAEIRAYEKIPETIELVKAIPVNTNLEKLCFAGCLFSTGSAWIFADNSTSARNAFEQAFHIAKEIQNKELILQTRVALANLDWSEGRYEAVEKAVEEIASMDGVDNLSATYGGLVILRGNLFRKKGEYTQAITCFEEAMAIFKDRKSGARYHYVLWALGTCYAALEDRDRAKIYLNLANNNESGAEFWRIKVLAKLTLAELHVVTGNFDDAEKVYALLTDLVGTDETTYFGRRLLRGTTLLHIKKGEFDTANELIDRLVIVAVKEKNEKEIMRLRLLKAEVLLRTGDAVQQDEARDILQETLAFFRDRGVLRHQAVALDLLARLDARAGYATDALKKVEQMLVIAQKTTFERLALRGQLARLVLLRKLGKTIAPEDLEKPTPLINKLNAEAERVVLARFQTEKYESWALELKKISPHSARWVNEFFEDFHFIPQQSLDIEIDRNSHYIREKHLGEIPFHNKFTLMRILCLLAEMPGREFSKEQLAREIWGQDYNPLRHDNNIYININRLRKLIEPNPRESRYIMNGPRGYYFNPEMKVNISSKISDVAPRSTIGIPGSAAEETL
jgi:tetratricopeptide (TPR) repeat protein/DNA-binding winged helix-turn-helix (wHTH) protein